MNNKFRSSVAGASIIITVTGLLSKGLGFIREVIFASVFGLSSSFDIYLVAAVLPLTINTIVLYLTQNYLIPVFNKSKYGKDTDYDAIIHHNLFLFISVGIILAVVLYIFSDAIISLYFQSTDTNSVTTAVNIFRSYLISIPINCAVSVLIAYQQTNFEFRYPAYSQLLLNVLFILLILIFSGELNIYAIPLGYNSGILFQMIFLFRKSGLKIKLNKLGSTVKNYINFVPGTLIIIILIESIGQLYIISDRYFYNDLPTGGIAALNYAQTVFLLPLSILSIAMSTAIFPRFVQCINNNASRELESVFNESIKINVAIFVPITILFLFYGDFILKMFFQRGKFSSGDTLVTYSVLIFFSISMMFYAIYNVINKLIYSLGLLKNLLYLTVLGVCLKIFLNFLFVDTLKQNGLALSTSISYIFFFVYGFYIVNRKLLFKNKYVFLRELSFTLLNGILSFFIARLLVNTFCGKESLIEITLFLILFVTNIFLVNHSLVKIIIRLFDILKGKPTFGKTNII